MKIKRFKLSALSAAGLRQKEMGAIIGGNTCGCACAYEGQGGSSTSSNMSANYSYGMTSSYGCNQTIYGDDCGLGVVIQNHA